MKQTNVDLIKLSKEIAYKGAIGRRREQFCVRHIKHKKEIICKINQEQNEEVKDAGKSITCHRGCCYSSCCMEYVDVTIQECEGIVYYLYHNEKVLKLFMNNYPKWRQKVDKIKDIVKPCEKLYFDPLALQSIKNKVEEVGDRYWTEKILCPFLENNICTIYEVRPYVCAGYYVTSPLSYCSPDYLGKAPVKRNLPVEEAFEIEFYRGTLDSPTLVCMQEAVYRTLENGYFYLSTIPGLEGLEKEAIKDKKIRAKYTRYMREKYVTL
jgi:Fe-S-cluster containining protein